MISMAPRSTASHEDTAIAMSDLESGKKAPSVTVTSINASERPVLGRRKTSGSAGVTVDNRKLAYDGQEDALTRIGNSLWKIHNASILARYTLYVLPVAIVLAVPIVLTDTVYKNKMVGGKDGLRLLGLFVWIEVIWVALWICKLIASCLPIVFQAVCGLISTGVRKYSVVLKALEIPMSLFLWTIVAYSTTDVIRIWPHGNSGAAWLGQLKLVFKASIAVAAVFLAEKTVVQMVSINYHRKQYHDKIAESKKLIRLLDLLYDASRQIFPEFCKEFEEEDADIQGNTLTDVRSRLAKAGVHTKIISDVGRIRDKVTAAFGAMASDISGKEVFSATSAHSIVVEALETKRASKALARRLWLSFVGQGKEALFKEDLIEVLGENCTEEAEEIFAVLDRDGNGDVSLDEMTMLIVSTGQERKNRAQSMHDISQAIAVLDHLLSVVVLVAIAFIYATFFSATFASKTTQLWTTFTGLAFAIGGTVTEFLACCIFLFVKHPYDVGDRVDISEVELIVEHISLMYSVFRRVDSNKTVQIPHQIANTLWIENVSRSKQMKERLSINVAATTTMEDILALRHELHAFVTADENRRDFQPDFDIELRNLNDLLKLELRVEINHKANFAQEHLRNARRNKFMCELLAAMRRIPIEPPGGAQAPLGDPTNPTYSVAITDKEATAVREDAAAQAESARLFPKGAATSMIESLSSGVQNPAQAMMSSLTGRRNGSIVEGRRSADGMWRI